MLALRAAKTRLFVAYLATAYQAQLGQPFPKCAPMNSWTRLTNSGERLEDGSYSVHPYSEMWSTIGNFYEREGLDDLCDAEIADKFSAAMSVGMTTKSGTKLSAKQVASAVQTWRSNEWFRYEQRRDGRRQVAYRYAPLALITLLTGQVVTDV